MEERFLRNRELLDFIKISKATLYRWVREGKFPKPIKLGARTVIWDIQEVLEHIQNKKNNL